MYKVGIYLRVRKACFVEGMSVRRGGPSVRATPGHGAQDARVLRAPRVSTATTGSQTRSSIHYKGVMDQILEQDLTSPKKQRHTAKAYLRTAQRRTRLPRQVHDSQRLRSRTPSSYPRDVLTSVPPSGTCPVRTTAKLE